MRADLRLRAPKSNWIHAPSSCDLLDQRVAASPSIASVAGMALFSSADEVAVTGLIATPGWLRSTGTGPGAGAGDRPGGGDGAGEGDGRRGRRRAGEGLDLDDRVAVVRRALDALHPQVAALAG